MKRKRSFHVEKQWGFRNLTTVARILKTLSCTINDTAVLSQILVYLFPFCVQTFVPAVTVYLFFLLDYYNRPASCCFLCSQFLIFASFSSARSSFKLSIGSDTIYIICIGIGHCVLLCGKLYLKKVRPMPIV